MPIAQFAGLASGIDSKALIDAIIDAKEAINDKRRKDIDHIKSENDALAELNTKFLSLNDLIDPFRTSNSGGLAKKAVSSDSTVATAAVGSNAVNASYALTVTSVANTATGSFDQTYSSGSTVVSTAGSGTVTITVGTGADQVTVSASVTQNSTTVDELVSALNADSDASGRITASAVNVGTSSSPSYKIVLTTQKQGTAQGNLAISVDAAVTELQTTTINQATNAQFSISGINGTITRSSNTVSDVISGVTFNLLKAGSSTITVNSDADTTADKIQEIVSAYNDIVKYINEHNAIEQDKKSSERAVTYGSLAKTQLDNDFLSLFREKLLLAESTSGTIVTSLSELGLSTNRDGTLTFDDEVFKTVATQDPTGVGEVLNDFADSVSGVSGVIYQYTQIGGIIDISETANNDKITRISDTIAALERQSAKLRESLTFQFARLESITSKLQNQGQALNGILAGLQ